MKIAALLPHVGVFGGVRRYVELGNVLSSRGHEYILYTPEGASVDWIEYRGKTAPLDKAFAEEHDVAISGDWAMLRRINEVPARLRVMQVITTRDPSKYHQVVDPSWLVLGVGSGWDRHISGLGDRSVPGGINPSVFKPLKEDLSWRSATKQPGEDFLIGTIGRIRKARKGTRLVLEAIRRLRDRRVKVVLYDDEPIRWPWRAWRVRRELLVRPSQEELCAYYNRLDLFVAIEKHAGWCNPAAEAMACGCPLLCYPDGTRDFALAEETAHVVTEAEPGAVCEALRRMIDEGARRQRFAEAGLRKLPEFHWQRTGERMEALLEEQLRLRAEGS